MLVCLKPSVVCCCIKSSTLSFSPPCLFPASAGIVPAWNPQWAVSSFFFWRPRRFSHQIEVGPQRTSCSWPPAVLRRSLSSSRQELWERAQFDRRIIFCKHAVGLLAPRGVTFPHLQMHKLWVNGARFITAFESFECKLQTHDICLAALHKVVLIKLSKVVYIHMTSLLNYWLGGKAWGGRFCVFVTDEGCFPFKQQQMPAGLRLLSAFFWFDGKWPLAVSATLNTAGHCLVWEKHAGSFRAGGVVQALATSRQSSPRVLL